MLESMGILADDVMKTNPRKKASKLVTLALTPLLALAGCGGSSGGSTTGDVIDDPTDPDLIDVFRVETTDPVWDYNYTNVLYETVNTNFTDNILVDATYRDFWEHDPAVLYIRNNGPSVYRVNANNWTYAELPGVLARETNSLDFLTAAAADAYIHANAPDDPSNGGGGSGGGGGGSGGNGGGSGGTI